MNNATVRAAVIPAPHQPVEIRVYPWPELKAGSAMLRTLFSEVCGTDVHVFRGRLAGVPYPLIPGHVSIGNLTAIRGSVTDIDGRAFREGDLVTFLDVHGTCGRCYECLVTKQTTRCPHRRVYGITYGAADGPLGGWADYIWMKPGVRLLRVPDGVDARAFISGGCGLVTATHMIERGDVRLGDSVVVLGAGPVGLAAAALSRASGAYPVIAVGAPKSRLEAARRMGATHTLSLETSPAERVEQVRAITSGHGADVVLEGAGDPQAVSDALDLVRDGGRVVVAGQYTDHGDVTLNPHIQINRKHVEIRGCWGSDYSHFHRALQFLATTGRELPWTASISREYGLEETNAALDAVERREVVKAIVRP
jgi:threonine dehydrogenase-like Zn-dependent dehydrogenase